MVEEVRVQTAQAAWKRARQASALRQATYATSKKAAARFADLKERAIDRAVAIVPELIQITIDSNYQLGMLSVRWPGHGRLHLPADSLPHRSSLGDTRPHGRFPEESFRLPNLPEPRLEKYGGRPPTAGAAEDQPAPDFDYFSIYP